MRECVTHHYACDCREEKFKEMESKLKEALSIIEELKASNDKYSSEDSWRIEFGNKTEYIGNRIKNFDLSPNENHTMIGGKLARKTKQSTDQRIEKLKKEVLP